MLNYEIDNFTIYKYGLYIASVVASIKGVSYQKINRIYRNLPIYSKKDIKINGDEIAQILNKEPGSYIKKIMEDLEKMILTGKINNEPDELKDYILVNYGG